jgi:hypothetical protein
VGQAVVAVEFVGHSPAFEFLGQFDALRERRELVGVAVKEAERRQPLQVVPDAVLVVWVTIDNTALLCRTESYSRPSHTR